MNAPDYQARLITYFEEKISCGFPSPAEECRENSLDFNDLLITRESSTFCLRATGNSMVGAGILPDDILVTDRSVRPRDGDIVVAEVDGGFTVKRLLISPSGQISLHPENPEYKDIVFAEGGELMIFGVVTGVVRVMKRQNHGRPV